MSSFYIPVSALRRQQQRLELLGTNIANINTAGYKASRMTFVETLGTVTGVSRTIFKQGALEFTGNATDLAIQGNGFFVIRNGEERFYTRAGAFSIDANGKLVNSDGFALQGWMGESVSGASSLEDIIIDNNLVVPAKATNNLWLNGNLNASEVPVAEVWSSGGAFTLSANGTPAVVGTKLSDLSQATNLTAGDKFTISGTDPDGNAVSGTYTYAAAADDLDDLLTAINAAFVGNATATLDVDGKIVLTDDETGKSQTTIRITADDGNVGELSNLSFVNTVPGSGEVTTSVVAYDSLGNSHTVTMEFIRTANPGEWEWRVACSDGAILSNQTGEISFNELGELEGSGVIPLIFAPAGGADEMNITICLGSSDDGYNGISQYDSVSTLLVRKQDGRGSGSLKDFYIDTAGAVIGLFTNGENQTLAQVALAQFANSGGLIKANGGNFIATSKSGTPIIDAASSIGATIESGSLEVSTVDMADQFTKMIEAQRAFQAAARVITTFDQILEETTRLKR